MSGETETLDPEVAEKIESIKTLELGPNEIALIQFPKGAVSDYDLESFFSWLRTTPLSGKIAVIEQDSVEVSKFTVREPNQRAWWCEVKLEAHVPNSGEPLTLAEQCVPHLDLERLPGRSEVEKAHADCKLIDIFV